MKTNKEKRDRSLKHYEFCLDLKSKKMLSEEGLHKANLKLLKAFDISIQ